MVLRACSNYCSNPTLTSITWIWWCYKGWENKTNSGRDEKTDQTKEAEYPRRQSFAKSENSTKTISQLKLVSTSIYDNKLILNPLIDGYFAKYNCSPNYNTINSTWTSIHSI